MCAFSYLYLCPVNLQAYIHKTVFIMTLILTLTHHFAREITFKSTSKNKLEELHNAERNLSYR